jgi:hypothetical protein
MQFCHRMIRQKYDRIIKTDCRTCDSRYEYYYDSARSLTPVALKRFAQRTARCFKG